MGSLISIIISVLAKLLPSFLDWYVKESKKPDAVLKDDAPAPPKLRNWFADKIKNHPGYKARMETKDNEKHN